MPVRRVYASRGVRSRGSTLTRRTRVRARATRLGVVALLAVIGGVAWFGAQALSAVGAAGPRTAQTAPLAAAPTAAAASMASLSTPGVSAAAAAPTADAPATTRQWDASAPGIDIDPALIARLDPALAGVDGHVSVAVKDLGSGRGAVLDGNDELPSASLYKLTVLYTVFDDGLSMAEELPITEEARSYDSGTMELGVGETLSVAEALERMITLSDNTSAVMLGSRVGAASVNASIRTMGLDTTHYSLERMTTSALDMLRFLDLLAHGRLVSPAASADMLHLLLRQRVNDRLPRLLPDDVQVAHKTGNLPGTVNDVGILYGPNSTVAVAALVSDTTDETAAATGIARLAQAASSYFEAEPAQTERPAIPPAPARPIPPVWREPKPPTPTPVPVVSTSEPARVIEVAPTRAAAPTQAPTALPSPTLLVVRSPTSAPTARPAVATAAPPAPTSTPVVHPTLAPSPTATAVSPPPTRPPTPRPTAPAPTAVPTAGRR